MINIHIFNIHIHLDMNDIQVCMNIDAYQHCDTKDIHSLWIQTPPEKVLNTLN